MNENQPTEVGQNSWFEKINSGTNIKGILLLLVVVILIGGLLVFNSASDSSKGENREDKTSNVDEFLANNTLVYGYWTEANSQIEAVDLSNGSRGILATLPYNIKDVKVISPNQLLFVKDTDESDYGKSLVLYDIALRQETLILNSDEDFGIDDYVVSANSKYIAVLEASLGAQGLLGGRSRLYSLAIESPGVKNLIYDESVSSDVPIHYPVAISNKGDIFSDKFIANSGIGWAYGMSVSDFKGILKGDIPNMQNGTYITQPQLSNDGSKLVFVGYDGTKGDGSKVTSGYRQVFVLANTVETLDLTTLERKKMLTSSSNSAVRSADWNPDSKDIIYTIVDNSTNRFDTYIYYVNSNSSKKIDVNFSSSGSTVDTVEAVFTNGDLLIGGVVTTNSALGNLGNNYSQPLDSLSVLNPSTQKNNSIRLGSAYVQFIDLKDANYFSSLISTANKGNNSVETQRSQLQLESFVLKPSLAPVRIKRISQPRQEGIPEDVQTCSEQMQAGCSALEGPENLQCMTYAASCNHCPIYLYGPEGLEVDVNVGTPIFSPNAQYDSTDGFRVSLATDGEFNVGSKRISSLNFEYIPAIGNLSRPKYGVIIKKDQVEETIKDFASKLNLNGRETNDATQYLKKHITKNYVYLSFYSHEVSSRILPLSFSTAPDNYRSIVFYAEQFEDVPNINYEYPVFRPITRSGFTVVEISFKLK